MKHRKLHQRDEFTDHKAVLYLDDRDEVSDHAAKAIRHWAKELGDPLFVYFIQGEDGGPVKIGQALDPVKRLRTLQCGNAQNLVIREVVLAAIDTEERMHAIWESKAGMRGEWFGRGHEGEILRCAHDASAQQMQMGHQKGWRVFDIANAATWLVRDAMIEPGWVKA